MFPVLVWMYLRPAKTEEQETIARFEDAFREYALRVPSFMPG
jgi:protein-S-isoprenylcysteine O-methyltransferase Ste14